MKRKHGILLFLASCIPGCGEMYQGYMKRGTSILAAFCGLFALAAFLGIGALTVLMLPLWLFSFFDSYNLRDQTDEGARSDDWLFGFASMDAERLSALCGKRHSLLGWGLVLLGVWLLYATVADWVTDLLSQFFDAWWISHILRYGVPRLAVTVGIIALGVWFIRGPKRGKTEDIPPFVPPAEPEQPVEQAEDRETAAEGTEKPTGTMVEPTEATEEQEADHGEQ